MSNSFSINRREFLEKSAAAVAAGAVLPRTALSYSRVLGANDRISQCHRRWFVRSGLSRPVA